MVNNAASGDQSVRPYFIPPGIDFAALPEPVRVAYQAIVDPTYRELVLEVENSLAKSAGITLVFLLALEIVEQFQLAQQMDFTGSSTGSGRADRDRLIDSYLRIVGAKQKAERFLLRLHDLRARNDAAAGLWRTK